MARLHTVLVGLGLLGALAVACSAPSVSNAGDEADQKGTEKKTTSKKKSSSANDDESTATGRPPKSSSPASERPSSDAGAPPVPSSCTADTECGAIGRICEGEVCIKGCRDDFGCMNGQRCEARVCVTGSSAETSSSTTCTNDAQCQLGSICSPSTHRCVSGCHTTDDCPTDETCSGGKCIFDGNGNGNGGGGIGDTCTVDGNCALGSICSSNACTPGCRADFDCPGTQVCALFFCF